VCSSAVYRFWVIVGVLGLGAPASGAALELTVDDDAGQPMAFRVQAFQAGRMAAQAWERGRARLELPAGKQTVLVRHGSDYDAVSMELDPGQGPPQDQRPTRQTLGGHRPRGRRGSGGYPGNRRSRCEASFQTPPTAALTIRAAGFAEVKKDLFLDSPLLEFCRNFNGSCTPEAYHRVRELLGKLEFEMGATGLPHHKC